MAWQLEDAPLPLGEGQGVRADLKPAVPAKDERELVRVATEGVLVLARDPVAPWESREILIIEEPARFCDLMAARGLSPEREPTVLMINGIFYSRAEWPELWIRPGDRAALMWLPAGGGKTSRIIAGVVMVIVGAILSSFGFGAGTPLMVAGVSMIVGAVLSPKVNMPTTDAANALAAPSPTYNLQAQGNYARLNQPIPAIYGRVRTFPDFAAQPWAEFVGNEQYLYQLLVIGQGEHDIEAVQIEDQRLIAEQGVDGIWRSSSPFDDVSWQIIEPGGTVNYFPTRVLLSDAVAQQELLTNESIGPFAITDAEINEVGIDLVAPKGLYYANDDGGLDSRSFTVQVWATRLRQDGAAWVPDGEESLLDSVTHAAATNTPQRLSHRYTLDTGRYRFRLVRTDAKDGNSRAGHDVHWVGLRGYVPGLQQYGNLTLLAMRAKASNQLSSQSSRKINVIATRKLPVWHPETGWSLPQPTRSIVWALADVLRNDQYGAGVADDTLPLAEWYALEQNALRSAEPEGEAFDYVFDRAMPAWEAIAHISQAGRLLTYQRGPSFVTMRDQYRAVPVALFNMRNIERGTFKLNFVLHDDNATDAVRVTYWDEQIWSYSSFDCVPPGVGNSNPEEIRLVGVQRRAQAAKVGHFRARAKRHRKMYGSFRTELEGRLIKPGDLIAVSHDLPEWGQSAELVSYTGSGKAAGDVLTLSEPLEWAEGEEHYIALARRNNSLSGPWRVIAGAELHQVQLAEPITDAALLLYVGDSAERTRVSFGPSERYAARCLVLPPLRMKGNSVEVAFVEDSPEAYDETGVSAPGLDAPWNPELTARPVVRALFVTLEGNSSNPALVMSWEAAGSPSYYLVEISTDGQHYSRVAEPTSMGCRIAVPLAPVSVRVAAVGSIRGDWVTWNGDPATMMSKPADVTGLALARPVAGQPTNWADPDCAVTWNAAARADAYRVEVWAAGVKLSEHRSTETSFNYSMAQNRAEGGPRRAIELRVWGLNGAGESESPAVLAVLNPQAAATVVQGQQTSEMAVLLTVPLPTEADYAGTRYVISQNASANPGTLALAADLPSWAATVPVTSAGTWYFWAANYDAFGSDALNWSPRGQVLVIESPKGVYQVPDASAITAAPGSPPPGGDAYWAAFDEATGRMAMWDQLAGRYIFAPTEAEVAADLAAVNDAIGGQIIQLDAAVVAEAQARAAAIAAEQQARAQALLDEATARQAAITTEQQARQSADESLAETINRISAGAGTQFDPKKIWFFDTTAEGWSGNGTPTVVDGWLRPANHATDPYVVSPTACNVPGSTYKFVKLRIKRVGSPVWVGELWWRATTDGAFSSTRKVSVPEPVFGADGIASLEFDGIAWGAGTIDQIRLDLSSNQSATDYLMIDWVAIGRPTPGAGIAALEEERQARISAVAAEATARNTLASQMRGSYDGNDLAQVTTGLIYSERQARTTADSALATRASALEATVNNGTTGVAAAHARITAEESARATGDSANATAINQVSARLNSGGDINQAIVQVVAQASATDNKLLGSWAVMIDAGGKLTGIKLLSDGTTSAMAIAADEVLIDGSVKAKSLAAGAVTAVKIAASAVTADKISVTSLSAISAYLGMITSAVIEMVSGSGWQYIRTASKWWSDGVNGWISAARPETSSYFQEFRASNGAAVVLEQKGGGPDLGGLHYRLQVRDAGGVDRVDINPAAGWYKFRGHIEALSGSFAGSLSAPSGTLGTITAGLMRNPTDTTRINLNETGAGELIRVNGVTRVWGDGRTRWSNQIGSLVVRPRWRGNNFYLAGAPGADYFNARPILSVYDERVGSSDDWEFVRRVDNGITFTFDTGIPMEALTDSYNCSVVARAAGWSIWWNGYAQAFADVLLVDCRVVYRMPTDGGHTWEAVTAWVEVTVRYGENSPVLNSSVLKHIVLDSLNINLVRLS